MEEVKIKHYKKLIKTNLKRNMPKFVLKGADPIDIAYLMTDKIYYYMTHYTDNFDPEKYTVTTTNFNDGSKFINISFKSGDITRNLIFLEDGTLFGVKHYNDKYPGRFSYGLPDKAVNNINFKFNKI